MFEFGLFFFVFIAFGCGTPVHGMAVTVQISAYFQKACSAVGTFVNRVRQQSNVALNKNIKFCFCGRVLDFLLTSDVYALPYDERITAFDKVGRIRTVDSLGSNFDGLFAFEILESNQTVFVDRSNVIVRSHAPPEQIALSDERIGRHHVYLSRGHNRQRVVIAVISVYTFVSDTYESVLSKHKVNHGIFDVQQDFDCVLAVLRFCGKSHFTRRFCRN